MYNQPIFRTRDIIITALAGALVCIMLVLCICWCRMCCACCKGNPEESNKVTAVPMDSIEVVEYRNGKPVSAMSRGINDTDDPNLAPGLDEEQTNEPGKSAKVY